MTIVLPATDGPNMGTMAVSAKITCTVKAETPEGGALLTFSPDYQDGRNKEWAPYTPSLNLSMTVNAEAAEHFTQGQAYTLTFAPDGE